LARRAGAAETRDGAVDGDLLDLVERRVDGGGLTQSGAFAPALDLVDDDPHVEHRSFPVHARGGADPVGERKLGPDELDAGQPHAAWCSTASP